MQRSASTRDRSVPIAAIAALLVVLVASRLAHLSTGPLDFDEGVYWLSMRLMRAGNPLFTSVYSSQPPAFLLLTEPPWNWLGGSIEAGRAVMLAWAVVGVGAGGVLGWCLGGRVVAVALAALLTVDPRMVDQSITLQADGPATSLALVSAAAAALALTVRNESGRAVAAAVCGAALALGVLTKLFDIAIVPCIVLLILSGPRRARVGVIAGLGALLAAAVILLPMADAWPAMWAQAVGLHLNTRAVYEGISFAFVWLILQTEWPLVAVAVIGLVVGRRAAHRAWTVGVVWTAGAFGAFVATRPLFPHHVVLAVPGLAVLGAAAIARLVSGDQRGLDLRRWRTRVGLGAIAGCVAGGLLLSHALAVLQGPGNASLVAQLRAFTPATQLLLGDDQFDQALAARDAPPQLVDTSGVRIRGEDLTASRLEASLLSGRPVCGVLFASGRLSGVAGFPAWVATEFPTRHELPNGAVLYTRTPCPP